MFVTVRRNSSVAALFITFLFVCGCASTQLNYNTLDLASSSEDLITSQVLFNLAKFRSSPYAIPSQVSIPSGSATTTNAITPTIGGALGPSATTTVANSAAAPLFFATTQSHVLPNGTIGASAGDQWSQNWTLTPLEDPDQLRRLRALYRFGAGITNRQGLACEYPLILKSSGGSASTSQTVNVFINGTKADSESKKSTDDSKEPYILSDCPSVTFAGSQQPDPAFLKPPGCVICDYKNDHKLVVNRLLSNEWLLNPFAAPPLVAFKLGNYRGQNLYLVPSMSDACSSDGLDPLRCSQREYSDFVLLILEATLQSTSSGAGKGSPQKSGTPGLLQEKAAPQFQIIN
jgi:hypothetical protein